MEATAKAPVESTEVTTAPSSPDRLRENFDVFIYNLSHVSEAMNTCVETSKRILANYEGTSRNVPLTLRPLIEHLELINNQIVHAIIEMRLNEIAYAHDAFNADGRGTWRMVLRILLRIAGEANTQLGMLPYLPKDESARQNVTRRYTQSYVLPVIGECTEYLKVLAAIFPTLIMVTFHPEALTDDEAKKLLAGMYTHPFWYSYDGYMTRFRNLFDTLKMTVLNSYTKSGFFAKNWARGLNGLRTLFTTHKIASKEADDLGKQNANMKFVKTLWNLAETGLPEKVVSWMKPGIKMRQYWRLNLTTEQKALDPAFANLEGMRVLYLYYTTDGAVKIPKEWHTSAPYTQKATEAQELVASTLVNVDEQHAQESLQKAEKKEKVKRDLMAEYEETKASKKEKGKKKHGRSASASISDPPVPEETHESVEMPKAMSTLELSPSAPHMTSNTPKGDLVGQQPSPRPSSAELAEPKRALPPRPHSKSASSRPKNLSISSLPSTTTTTSSSGTASPAPEFAESTSDSNLPLALNSPKTSRPTTPQHGSAATHLGPIVEEADEALAEQLFQEIPLTPFLPQPEGALELESGESDLVDISDATDPSLRGHIDGVEPVSAPGAKTATSASDPAHSATHSHTIPHPLPSSDTGNYDVVLHFHGGGFVSGSPSSHESYLRTWANTTNAIVLSVDYSLGPDYKYPTAFNECYFFYHWLVAQDNALGIRPRKIVLSGDSAGGNLAVAVALKACAAGIRVPDGLVVAYPALNCTKGATPSRLVFGNDILVPYYFLEVCLDGYVDENSRPSEDFCLSPIFAPDEVIQKLPDDLVFMVAGYDPLLDDTVRFLRRLDKLNKPYIFEVFDCPHGFWNFDALLLEAERAMYRAGNMIRCIFDPLYARIWQLAEEKHKRLQAAKTEPHQSHVFSIDAAFRPYASQLPRTFAPLNDHELAHHLAQPTRSKSKKAVTRTPDNAPTTPNSVTPPPQASGSR